MNAREQAELRLKGIGSGQAWDQVDAIRGVGWALLAVAEAIAGKSSEADVLHDAARLCTGCAFCAPAQGAS